jgi:HCOMODA/2-hydroxy-3-carboxy-muconic semialdehyde decarboxylase
VLLRSAYLSLDAATTLGNEDALLLRGNGAVTTADTPGMAVARMWILARTCDIWLRANAVTAPRPLVADEIDAWRSAGRELLPRLWEHLRRRGHDHDSVGDDFSP